MSTPKGTKPWNAGTGKGWIDKRGYRWIYVTDRGKRRAKREHRHIIEQHLGRALCPEEMVHHINGNTADNRIENLEVTTWAPHTVLHHRGRKHGEYAKRTQAVFAEYREENKRLRDLNTELLEALKACHLQMLQSDNGDEYAQEANQLAIAAIAKAEGNHD